MMYTGLDLFSMFAAGWLFKSLPEDARKGHWGWVWFDLIVGVLNVVIALV